MTDDCARSRGTLGVYVLGAIDPAERAALERHLERCPACRDELAGLAGLPALLGRVDEEQIEQLAGPPPDLLDAMLARAAERRRPLRRWAPLAAAAAVLLVAGMLLGGLVGGGEDRRAVPPVPASSAAGERVAASDPRSGVQGYVMIHRKAWGTGLEIYVTGIAGGSHCRLRVIARDGQKDALGSWTVPAGAGKGRYGEYEASTRFRRDQLYSFEVVTLDGRPLLTIPA
ncbi:anti-sigma factor family protein [Actinomadura macrotermitis]|uniref:Putative zinc-finger domain-containing protein n=1 Tax=Actinomadura macrotermitis TaxID=2585200 RepID=A0A7K0BTH1_9ACTN|nr:zf-HC2 domain-containing protein [Actinomadura macrotermitis]MQY04469.1 hypothetical protein [Actinomadura macrotermitis]